MNMLPVFTLVEMKKPYQAYDPLVQIGIWAVAGFERLRLLAAQAQLGTQREEGERARPLLVPMWTTQGGSWSLYIGSSPSDERVKMYGPVFMKNASDLADIYALIETNRRIMQWGNDVYLPWLEKAVLESMLAV
jgi:hypothetical protein